MQPQHSVVPSSPPNRSGLAGMSTHTDTVTSCSFPRLGRVWLLAAACGLAVYLPTLAPGVLWGDSGDAQIRVLAGALSDPRELARAHVTYYATAIALAKVLRLEPAWAANLVAALAGAVTVANFAALLTRFVRRRVAVASGTALLLLSHTLWQLSTGAEVITFFTMCLSFELLMFARFAQTSRPSGLVAAAFANGLGFSTHNFALLTWPAYVILFVFQRKRLPSLSRRHAALAIGAWLLGAVPLAVLVLLEWGRVGSLAETARSLLVGRFGPEVFNTGISLGLVVRLIGFVGLNFPTPLILLAAGGWWRLRRSDSRGCWLFLSVAAATFILFGARYTVPDQYTFLVPSYIFLVLFTAVGVDEWLAHRPSTAGTILVLALSLTAPVAYALAPPLARRWPATAKVLSPREIPYREPYWWFLTPWRTGYHGPERYAREVFEALPPDALLLIDTTMRRPLVYLQRRERLRPDVRLPDAFDWWDGRKPITIGPDNARSYIDRGLLFCATTVRPYIPAWLLDGDFEFESVGLVYRVTYARPRESGPTSRPE